MKKLIVGRFTQQTHAETTARALQRNGFAASEMSQFFVNPQGQHNLNVLGGDVDESVATQDASSSALGGAVSGVGAGALLGIATIPVLGPAGPLLGAAVGAYTGSLVGALGGMDNVDPQDPTQPQHAGVVLAVAVATDYEESTAAYMQSNCSTRPASCITVTGSISIRSHQPMPSSFNTDSSSQA